MYKFGGKELQDELNLNVYDFHARNYMPEIGRTTTQDPSAEKYYSISSYSFFGNNPVFFTDPDGREIEPVDNKSGRRVQREIRKTFREQGYNNVAKLFKYNKETGKFNNISQGAFDKAISKDVTNNSNLSQDQKNDVTALAKGYFDATNSSEVHSVEAVKRNESLTSGLSIAFGHTTGADVETRAGGGFNYDTPNGSHTVFVTNPQQKLDFVENGTGNIISAKVKAGDLLAHELLGHGLTHYSGNNSSSAHYYNAIQVSNLYLRVINGGPKIYDNGAKHGGNPRGVGIAIPGSLSWQIPSYLK